VSRLHKPKREPLEILWKVHGPRISTPESSPRFGARPELRRKVLVSG
jgi:hypothetical protein